MSVRPAKTQINLGIPPVWSESSLCTQWVAEGPRFLHADSEDSDQTGRMPRLIWVFAGPTLTLLVLSCRGSYWHFLCVLFQQTSSSKHNYIEKFLRSPYLCIMGFLICIITWFIHIIYRWPIFCNLVSFMQIVCNNYFILERKKQLTEVSCFRMENDVNQTKIFS